MKILKISLFFVLIFGLANPVMAIEFSPGNILADQELTDYTSMSVSDISFFLNNKSGTLKNYVCEDENSQLLTASEIIFNAAQEYQINPKVLLVMLQKEQSLVEDTSPADKQYDWAMGYGVCDSCSMDDERIQKFKGFGKQVDNAAGAQRWYIENSNNGWIKTFNKTYTISGQDVFIENQATANLYNYTPHISGNYNFWKIWHNWFFQKYPDGTLLQVPGEVGVWLVQNGERRPFLTKSALLSRFDPQKIILVDKDELNQYEIGSPLKFANYALLKTPLKDVYMLVNDQLRKFASAEVIRTIGFNPEEFEDICLEEFSTYELGADITMESAYPAGALLQDKKSGGVFFVQEGIKHPIIAKDIMLINFPKKKITAVSSDELAKFIDGDSVKIKDGEIVKTATEPAVYIISNGKKMPVASGEIFENLGYKWENLKIVDAKALANLPLGNYLELEYKNAD